MKQEKHEIRCSEFEKRLGKCRFFEKSYKNTRTKKEAALSGGLFFAAKIERKLEPVQSASRHIVPMALKSALLRSNFCGRALFALETV